MSDAVESAAPKKKRFRSPPYPMYDLGKAVERASELYEQAKHHQVQAQVLADAWSMASVDGKVWRAAAALKQYGLLVDSGTGKTRKFQLTDVAKRLILDVDPASEKRKDALRSAALSPMIHNELWHQFGTTKGIGDQVVYTYLTIDREETGEAPYSPSAAEEVLGTYRASLAYARISDSESVSPYSEVKEDKTEDAVQPNSSTNVKVGDFIKWTSGGVDQFEAEKVEWVSDDNQFVRVFGSPTGIPVIEVEKVDPNSAKMLPSDTPKMAFAGGGEAQGVKPAGQEGKLANFSGYIVDGKLQLKAEVSAGEIDKLKEVLDGYKAILNLIG